MTDEGRSSTWIVAVLAVAVGFLAAWLIFGGDNDDQATVATGGATTTTTTTTATTGEQTQTQTATVTTPANPEPSLAACIELWNRANNRGAQTALANLAAQQPIRIHVGETANVPPKCLITVVANDGSAYTFAEGGGTTFPYAPAPGRTDGAELPAAQKTTNAVDEPDGRLRER